MKIVRRLTAVLTLSLGLLGPLARRGLQWLWYDFECPLAWYMSNKFHKYIAAAYSLLVWKQPMQDWTALDTMHYLPLIAVKAAPAGLTVPASSAGHNPTAITLDLEGPADKAMNFATGSSPAPALGLNPLSDLDLTTSTDCEDLAAFANDILEFVEQDRSLLVDSLTDVGVGAAAGLGLYLGARALSVRAFKRRR